MKRIFVLAILAVSALVAVPAARASSVALSWNEPATTLPYGFNVYRAAASNGACPAFSTTTYLKVVGSIPSAQTAWSDTTIALNTTYCYAITAYNTATVGESGPSNIFMISTTATTPPPSSVTPPNPTTLTGSFVQ